MALYQVSAGDRILAADINQYYNILKGVAASGEAVTLIYNAAGVLILQPSSNPAAGTEFFQVKNAAGTVQGSITSDGKVKVADGTAAAPSLRYQSEASGAFLAGGGTLGWSITGSQVMRLTNGALLFDAAATRIVPGVTSLSLRNNANSADNLLITDAGVVTVRSTLTVTGASISIGTNPASAGAIRIPYQQSLFSRNSTNDGDESLIRYSGSTIEMGAAGSSGVKTFGPLLIGNRPAFVAGDKYLVVDASGNVHVSALGPAS